MRVGIDVSPITRGRTGVGQYTYSLLKCLLALSGPDSAISNPQCAIEFEGLSTGWRGLDLADLPLRRHVHLPVPTRVMYGCWNALRWPQVERLLGPLAVYHATNYFLPPVRKARRVVTFYDLAFLRVPELCSPAIVGPFSRQIRRFATEADAIITCSRATRDDIVDLLDTPEAKIHVAYGGVAAEFRPSPSDSSDAGENESALAREYGIQPPFLLFVSTLEPRKNVEGLLHAFALVQQEIPHQLVLIGREGWQEQPTAVLAERLGLAGRVKILGYLRRHEDLARFYAAAEAFVFPSLYEGFGLPVLESLACGCPVITSDRAALPEVAGDAALFVDPDDVGSIAAAIRRLAGDAQLRAHLRGQGPIQAAKFTWEGCARATLDVYRSLA
ncbi:MAG: glycosyltransferase family 4 protein [Candidatus Hydrogenedentes bacterium]|nr:glycosyltransferase family 4 protein [Candidatus Hydrogenedentota bacterium]